MRCFHPYFCQDYGRENIKNAFLLGSLDTHHLILTQVKGIEP